MIRNRVYGPLRRLDIKFNPIPHGGSGRNVPPYQEIFSLYVVVEMCPLIKKFFLCM